jgi:hypothetical protein
MKLIRLLTAVALLAPMLRPACAAEAIFPPGQRVGLIPPAGLSVSKSFPGFETEDHGVKVLVTELPANAYLEVVNTFKANAAGAIRPESIQTGAGLGYYTVEGARDGNANVRRYSMILSGGTFSGYVAVQVPENTTKIFSDDAVRQMFATAVVRKEVPIEEQLSLMPFNVTDLGHFKTVRTLAPSAALVLADGDEATGFEPAPFMVIGLITATPPEPDDRGRFAQEAATTIPGVRDARITMSEPIRIDGQPAYETRIDAISGKDIPVTVVQWLRFGGPRMLRIIGSAPRDQWSSAFPRFRAVRDAIQPRG